jgi:hypothetical protein
MGHIILYCTFDKRYFCLLNDLLYESIVVFVFSFLFVWDIYLNILSKYYNIYISLLGLPYKHRKKIYSFDLSIFYCQIYTTGLNTSFTTYMKFSAVSYKHRSDREHDG